jgi:hypothetical protein
MALISLDRLEEAIDCCKRCITYDQDNKGVQSTLERATKLKAAKDKKEQERQQRLRQEQEAKMKLHNALQVGALCATSLCDIYLTGTKGKKYIRPTKT